MERRTVRGGNIHVEVIPAVEEEFTVAGEAVRLIFDIGSDDAEVISPSLLV